MLRLVKLPGLDCKELVTSVGLKLVDSQTLLEEDLLDKMLSPNKDLSWVSEKYINYIQWKSMRYEENP